MIAINSRLEKDELDSMYAGKKQIPRLSQAVFEGSDLIPSEKEGCQDNYFNKFSQSILDQKRDYPLPRPVISVRQRGELVPILTLKSFSLWHGKQKSKKTTVLALAVAAFIKRNTTGDEFFIKDLDGTVLFFDNEQGESYAARTMKLILKLAGLESSPHFIYCDLREHSPKDRMKIIQAGIEYTENVRLVVIDGIVDLLNDFMDASEGHLTITEILKLCSHFDIHVAGVLHQNKNDKNARAHVGSIGSQKCETEIATEVDPDDRNQSFVHCVNSRGLPFETFAIRWDNGSLPRVNVDWTPGGPSQNRTAKNYERNKEMAEAVFKPLISISHTEAITGIMNASMKSESTAKRMLKDFMGWGFVVKGSDGNYRLNVEGSGFTRVQKGFVNPGS